MMTTSSLHAAHVPVYIAANANLAWIVQDHLLANGIEARIEVSNCDAHKGLCTTYPEFSVCVPEEKVLLAKELAATCEATKIIGFLAA